MIEKGFPMSNFLDKTDNKIKLTLDGPLLTVDKFLDAIENMFGIIKEVSLSVAKKSGKTGVKKWVVSVEKGSAVISCEAREASPEVISKTVHAVSDGLYTLEHKSIRPPYFSDSTLVKVGKLAAVIDLQGKLVDKIQVTANNKALTLSHQTFTNIQKLITKSEAYGSVEGTLWMVSGAKGYKFSVYDDLTNKAIECHFKDDMLDEVIRAFGKHVSVSGLIKYNEKGEPKAVYNIKGFKIFSKEGLPTFYDVKGILGA